MTGKISEGLHFEVTLIQIYRVALSAGKAHRDHKHHHAHHFDHEGKEIHPTTKSPPVVSFFGERNIIYNLYNHSL